MKLGLVFLQFEEIQFIRFSGIAKRLSFAAKLEEMNPFQIEGN
jgi:hypothetical protein